MSERVDGGQWKHTYNRCEHIWYSKNESPGNYAGCNSGYWNRPHVRLNMGKEVNRRVEEDMWSHKCKTYGHYWESETRMALKCANARCKTYKELSAF